MNEQQVAALHNILETLLGERIPAYELAVGVIRALKEKGMLAEWEVKIIHQDVWGIDLSSTLSDEEQGIDLGQIEIDCLNREIKRLKKLLTRYGISHDEGNEGLNLEEEGLLSDDLDEGIDLSSCLNEEPMFDMEGFLRLQKPAKTKLVFGNKDVVDLG